MLHQNCISVYEENSCLKRPSCWLWADKWNYNWNRIVHWPSPMSDRNKERERDTGTHLYWWPRFSNLLLSLSLSHIYILLRIWADPELNLDTLLGESKLNWCAIWYDINMIRLCWCLCYSPMVALDIGPSVAFTCLTLIPLLCFTSHSFFFFFFIIIFFFIFFFFPSLSLFLVPLFFLVSSVGVLNGWARERDKWKWLYR